MNFRLFWKHMRTMGSVTAVGGASPLRQNPSLATCLVRSEKLSSGINECRVEKLLERGELSESPHHLAAHCRGKKTEQLFESNSLVTVCSHCHLRPDERSQETQTYFLWKKKSLPFLLGIKFQYVLEPSFKISKSVVGHFWSDCRCALSGHLDLEGLFLVNGNAERVDWLRQRYDSGEEVELEKEADLASAVSLLRLFLQELPEPVIPTEIQRHILQLHQGVCLLLLPFARHIQRFVLLRLVLFHPVSLFFWLDWSLYKWCTSANFAAVWFMNEVWRSV